MESNLDMSNLIYIDTDLCLHVEIKYFKKKDNYENIIKYIFKVIDKNIELKQKKFNCITLDAYIDLKDYKLKEIDIEFIKIMVQICQEKYPDNLKIIYIKNANIMIKTIYSIIRPFVDKDTRKKIFFIKKNKKNKEQPKGSEEINKINEECIDELFDI